MPRAQPERKPCVPGKYLAQLSCQQGLRRSCVQGGELNVLLQLPWLDADVVKKISRKGGARSVAELMGMGEQERLELLVTSGEPCSLRLCTTVVPLKWMQGVPEVVLLGMSKTQQHIFFHECMQYMSAA